MAEETGRHGTGRRPRAGGDLFPAGYTGTRPPAPPPVTVAGPAGEPSATPGVYDDEAGGDDQARLAADEWGGATGDEAPVGPGHGGGIYAGGAVYGEAEAEDYVYDDGEYDDDFDDGDFADDDWDQEDGGAQQGRRRRLRVRHPVLVGFLGAILVVIVLGGAGVLWAAHQIYPSGRLGPKVLVTIPTGASSGQIGNELAKAGIIHSGGLFRYYFKVEGGGSPLLPGTYLLAKNQSYDQVITTLQAGPVVLTDKLVIPEGFTLRQIAERVARLPGMHLSAAKFLALSSSGSVRSPLEPAGVNDLEGLVYPATYNPLRTDTETTILEEMVGAFDQHMTALGLPAAAARLHMTPYQVITVASIIQGEAKFGRQFPDVASVIYNRLSSGMALGTDSTLIYALRLAHPNLKIATVNYAQPSPYNTRLHLGLPPTPIDSPSLPALAAAASPPHTTFKYFVAVNASGNLAFASTAAGFAQLVTQCQANHLC